MRIFIVLLGLFCAARTVAEDETPSWGVTDLSEPKSFAVDYEVVDGWAVHAGDMVLGTAKSIGTDQPLEPKAAGLRRRKVVANYTTRLWPRGLIPYVIDTAFSAEARADILAAIEEWNQKTVITLFPRTSEQDYLRFRMTTENCRSQVGKVGGEQSIWWVAADSGCGGLSSLLHEIGHTVGLWHEHQRRDRHRYLTVREEGISPAGIPWMKADNQPLSGPYDLASVMHYHAFAYSRDGLPVLETIPPGIDVRAGKQHLSVGDIYGVATLYRRTPWWTTITTNPQGLEIEVNGRLYTTPATFFWLKQGPKRLSAPPTQIRKDTRYVFGRWSDGGDREHEVSVGGNGNWYQADYIVQHLVTASPHPTDAGTVTIDPASPDGYYTSRTALSIHPQANTANEFRFWKWGRWRAHGLSAVPAQVLVRHPDQFGAHFTQDPLVRIESAVGPFLVHVDQETKLAPVALHPNDHPGPATVSVPTVQTRPVSIYGPSRFRFSGWEDGGPLSREVNVEEEGELVAIFQVERYTESTPSPSSAAGVTDTETSFTGDEYFPDGSPPSIPNRDWGGVWTEGGTATVERMESTPRERPQGVSAVSPETPPGYPPMPLGTESPAASYDLDSGGIQRLLSSSPETTGATGRTGMETPLPRVTPRALTFVSPLAADAPPQHLTVTNPGSETLRFRLSRHVGWLQAEPGEGVLQPSQQATVAIRTRSAGLPPDTHFGELHVRFSDKLDRPIGYRAVQVAFAVVLPSNNSQR